MCKTNGWNGEEKSWFEIVNDIGRDIEVHARDEYDTFLEKCLEPWGITKENAYRFEGRMRMEEENESIKGFETVSYQRFYIDGAYAFTVVFKQKPVAEGGFISGMITTYEKVMEQDLTPKKINMTNKEAVEILETVRGMSANKEEDEAFNLAIAALEEQDKYQWIFACVGDPKWDNLFEEVEKALGFKLFYWQKTYIMGSEIRRFGGTTANILRSLLDVEGDPLDYTRPASGKRDKFYRDTLLDIKEKLNKAVIKTREVWRSKAKKDAFYKKRAEHIPASGFPPDAIRNYCGLFDKED